VGVNIKGAFRLMPDYSDADDTGNNKGELIEGSGMSQSAVMLMADAGLLTSFLSMRTGLQGKSGNVRITVGNAVHLDKISLDINYTFWDWTPIPVPILKPRRATGKKPSNPCA
jgi:hypothetical protein